MTSTVELIANGRRLTTTEGTSVAAALLDAGIHDFRRSVRGEPRAPLCGMGICLECRVTIDDVAHRRACLVPVADGMQVTTSDDARTASNSAAGPRAATLTGGSTPTLHTDVVVIGAGPAGMAAAVAAHGLGRHVTVIDAGLTPGGQIWRHHPSAPPPAEAETLVNRLTASGATLLFGASAVELRRGERASAGSTGNGRGGGSGSSGSSFTVLAERAGEACRIDATTVVLATGARELFLPFPGWTLPGVVGVGAAQALLKMGSSVAGRRVVVAGTGPLLLPVAASLSRAGARLTLVVEQAAQSAVARFAASLWRRPRLLLTAARYRAAFAGTRYVTGSWVTAADGNGRVERVTVTDGSRSRTIDCDLLCVAYGLVPNTELARLAGCATSGGTVAVDERQQTSVPGIYCAGEPTGVGGADLALIEGEIAGLAAAGAPAIGRQLLAARGRLRVAATVMDRAFAPRTELRSVCTDETIVCRCEDVARGALEKHWSSRQAKLYTRAGMGACQGRVCGAALEFLFGWTHDSVRAPIEPALLSTLVTDFAPAPARSSSTSLADGPTLHQGAT